MQHVFEIYILNSVQPLLYDKDNILFITFQLLSFLYFSALLEIPTTDSTSFCGILMLTSLAPELCPSSFLQNAISDTSFGGSICHRPEAKSRANISAVVPIDKSYSGRFANYKAWMYINLSFGLPICLIYKTYKLILSNLTLKNNDSNIRLNYIFIFFLCRFWVVSI